MRINQNEKYLKDELFCDIVEYDNNKFIALANQEHGSSIYLLNR
jgi:hypothetical protein